MTGTAKPSVARGRPALLQALDRIPSGRLTSPDRLARATGMKPLWVIRELTSLPDNVRDEVPWHRVVAEGGAVGRHARSREQIARLRSEGVPVSPAGIIEDAARRMADPVDGIEALQIDNGQSTSTPPGRARGFRDRP